MTPAKNAFRRRQAELSGRLSRLSPRCFLARRLQKELNRLVRAELEAETAGGTRSAQMLLPRPAVRLTPMVEFPEEEGHELAWFQK